MHDGVVVVGQQWLIELLRREHIEVIRLTPHYVRLVDDDVLVPIASCVFMMEADGVAQFVYDDAKLLAVASNRNWLTPVSVFAQEGTATIRRNADGLGRGRKGATELLYSPTALDRKVNIVCVQLGITLHKLDAREVLPVAHGLLEERLVCATEDRIDLVGYHAIVPSALLPHSHSTASSCCLWRHQHIPACICPEQSRCCTWSGHYMW